MTLRTRALGLAALATVGGCGPPSTWTGLSPDHRQAFSVFTEGALSCIEVVGQAPECYEGLAVSRIVYSPDSRHLAFPVRQVDQWFVVHDGVFGPAVDGVGEIVFSPDGKRLAYAAVQDESWIVVADGRPTAPVDSIAAGSLLFSPDSRHFAFLGYTGLEMTAVVDGRSEARMPAIAQLAFAADGRAVFTGRDGSGSRLHFGDVVYDRHDAVVDYVLDPTGGPPAYVARDEGRFWVISDSSRWGPFRRVTGLRLRPHPRSIAFVAADSTGARVMMDGDAEPVHEAVDPPVFSADGSRWGYVAHDSIGSLVIVDGKLVDERQWAGGLTFSADGERLAYVTRSQEGEFVVTDRASHAFDMVLAETLQFVDEGARWAVLAGTLEDRKLFVVCEGIDDRRAFEWFAFGGVADRGIAFDPATGGALEALRAWVGAEAALMIEEEGSR